MTKVCTAGLAVLFCIFATIGYTQTVTLSDPSGTPVLDGPVLHGDDHVIEIDSKYGPVAVNTQALRCQGDCPQKDMQKNDIRIAGEPWVIKNLIALQIEAYSARQGISYTTDGTLYRLDTTPETTIELRAVTSEQAIQSLIKGDIDIALTLRPTTKKEAALLQPKIFGAVKSPLRSLILALDALVPVVSLTNPVTHVSDVNLLELLDSKITNWKDLGGPDQNVDLLPIDPGLNALLPAYGLVTGINPAPLTTYDISEGMFGVMPLSRSYQSQVLTLLGPCGYGPALHRRSVKTEDYPLSLPIIAYLAPRPLPPIAKDVLEFIQSPSGHLVTQRAGFFDPSVEEISLDVQGARLASAIQNINKGADLETVQKMAALMSRTSRLSTTFRFDTGATELDTVSRAHLQTLVSDLQSGRYMGRKLYLVGFSDGAGPASINLELSKKRADVVLKSLRARIPEAGRDRHSLATVGFGEALPIDCDDQIIGREVNRRVEVWIE